MGRNVIPFGKYKGKPINQLPDSYLRWLSQQIDGDLDYWARLAITHLKERQHSDDIEAVADDFLRSFGINPRDL